MDMSARPGAHGHHPMTHEEPPQNGRERVAEMTLESGSPACVCFVPPDCLSSAGTAHHHTTAAHASPVPRREPLRGRGSDVRHRRIQPTHGSPMASSGRVYCKDNVTPRHRRHPARLMAANGKVAKRPGRAVRTLGSPPWTPEPVRDKAASSKLRYLTILLLRLLGAWTAFATRFFILSFACRASAFDATGVLGVVWPVQNMSWLACRCRCRCRGLVCGLRCEV